MKTKPFNLEEALNGAKVVTRDGREVSQLTKFEGSKDYQLAGVTDGVLYTWTEQGGYYTDRQSNSDLFLAVETQSICVNVFMNSHGDLWVSGNQYKSFAEAHDNEPDTSTMKYIKTIEITVEI
jgi:hypothetical protein